MRDYLVLDVFTSNPLEGNQLAVFTDGAGIGDDVMQHAAREMNLSETVFLLAGDEEADAHIRIFTPSLELRFAGHPTLGSAFVVGERLGLDRVRLRTAEGVIAVELRRQGEAGPIVFGEMAQPIPSIAPFERREELLAALGVDETRLPVEEYVNGPRHAMVTLGGEAEVAALRPDVRALEAFGELLVSCFAGDGESFKTRMFAPLFGVVEDPATGSAAGPLALHLARHGVIPFGRQIEIHQGVEIKRPSVLYALVEGSADAVERVLVGGSAVVVGRGQYRLS